MYCLFFENETVFLNYNIEQLVTPYKENITCKNNNLIEKLIGNNDKIKLFLQAFQFKQLAEFYVLYSKEY